MEKIKFFLKSLKWFWIHPKAVAKGKKEKIHFFLKSVQWFWIHRKERDNRQKVRRFYRDVAKGDIL
jgi:hypothetical protein